MPQSLAQIYLHIVFSTKNRRPFLQDASIRDEMHKYLGGTCNNLDCSVLRVGGVADHVYILCRFGRTLTVADLVKELKRDSSKWIKTKAADLTDFHWQNGYGAFSVSPGHVDLLRLYVVSSALAWGHFLGVARATARKPDRGPRQKIIEKKRKAHLNGPP